LVEIELVEKDILRYKRVAIKTDTWIKRLFSKEYQEVYNEILVFSKIGKLNRKLLIEILVKIENYKNLISNRQLENNKLEYPSSGIGLEQYSENLSKLEWVKKYRETISRCTIINTHNHYDIINKYLMDKNDFDKKMIHLFDTYYDVNQTFNDFVQHINLNSKNINFLSLNDLYDYVSTCSNNFIQIENLIDFNLAYNKCSNNGLSDFCKAIIDQKLKNNYYEIFLKRFYTLLIDGYLNDLLPGFSGSSMDVARGTFKDAEKAIQTMAKTIIERNIMNGIPNYNGIEGYNIEVAILRTEANKSRKLLPFRVLFSKIPNLITRLKPCLMMSPLSVSTFLRGTNMTFDTVIFDEASQVKPENAIGAIFRAKQIIVTGDKEQLPPTNFFQNIDGDEEQETDNIDTSSFDSILDVSSSFISQVRLRWHYRSKFEELIRPSNKEIYKNLITFPSISKPNTYEGIMFCHVNGVYVDRRNENEADKVIESLANILEKYGLTKSIGVVTFNSEQQLLIERKINHFRRTHPHYEDFFTNMDNNPFFVKNIETVQGDERDIIIMSIGYGPDGKGKVSMNFGPLNQTNGYRRLNVAVTRAKSCLVLITSIKAADIDLNRTNSRGVAFLKHYLEYAEFGEDDKVDDLDDLSGFDSPFEEDVYNELTSLGYNVKKQVGCSGYRIDLAIVNPNNPAEFILGIECDGATYHSSKSVRDRDRLRQEVLEDRNWIIYRIWSTDWIKNKKSQIEKLLTFIKGIDKSKKDIGNNVQTEIPIINVEKDNTIIKFDTYPNYDELTSKYESDAHETYITKYLLEVIKATSPIHENELKKIVPYFWGRQKYTSVVDTNLKPILRYLSYHGEISRKGEFIYHKNTPIKFRKTDINSTRRDFTSIHTEELKSGILMILEVTKIMKEDQLLSMVVEFCGYQAISSNIRDIMNTMISSIVKSKIVKRVDDSLIELTVSQKEE
jgi:very-short-patch-repair endonuclease